MTPITPLVQPPVEDLRCALMMAELAYERLYGVSQIRTDFESIARFLRDALSKLGEPSPYTVQVAQHVLDAASHVRGPTLGIHTRDARDVAAAILHAAVSGPPLTSEPRT